MKFLKGAKVEGYNGNFIGNNFLKRKLTPLVAIAQHTKCQRPIKLSLDLFVQCQVKSAIVF